MKSVGIIGMTAAVACALVTAGCGSSPRAVEPEQAAAPDSIGVGAYYVRADGDDRNPGISEEAPFRTLQRAVEAAAATLVKRITVIGALRENIAINDADPSAPAIQLSMADGITTLAADPSGDGRDPDSIVIAGKPGASGQERAVLTSPGGDYTVFISHATVVFEHIEIADNPSDPALFVEAGCLILGTETKITRNGSAEAGRAKHGDGGGIIAVGSMLVMRDNAEVSGNRSAEPGGGLFLQDSVLTMRNQSKITGNSAGKPGGGVYLQDSSLVMCDAAQIAGNVSSTAGGGIAARGGDGRKRLVYSSIVLNGDSNILSNKAQAGGGAALLDKALITLDDSALVSGNSATERSGGVFVQGNVKARKGANAVIANNNAPREPDGNFKFE
ncbi:MAG: hypothetical protein LBK63_04760 [Treponema sp.]|nr:hypothetical protein [Treponema sp.]